MSSSKQELFQLLQSQSVKIGEFTLKSGLKSNFYLDCRLTALHARGGHLIGEVLYPLIVAQAEALALQPAAVGGLTLGADPVSLAVALASGRSETGPIYHAFCVRKEPKDYGRGKQIEGPFRHGMTVVVIDDVITTGSSTFVAIEAVEREGGRVGFVACVVDREEGGRQAIEDKGYPVVAAFVKSEFFTESLPSDNS